MDEIKNRFTYGEISYDKECTKEKRNTYIKRPKKAYEICSEMYSLINMLARKEK
jgi:hypothetical protein